VPVLTALAENLSLSAHLGVLDDLEVVYLVRRTPNHAFASNIRIGSRLPAHAANMGRIVLAHLPPSRVEHMYCCSLRALLDADRAAGLAWSDGNYEAGISSVAAAIFDGTNAPVAALNVSGQSAQFVGPERRAQIAAAVTAAALEISQRLGWRGPDRIAFGAGIPPDHRVSHSVS
jgi:DNA-binding IclR family transcriptional regulator